MRELILGAVLVPAVGLGVFFFPESEPKTVYPVTKQEAVRMLDRAEAELSQVKFSGWNPYSAMAGGGVVEYMNRGAGSDAVCIAEVTTKRNEGVTVEVSCPGAKETGPLAPYKREVAEIALSEAVAATLSGRSLDQKRVDAAFAKLDHSGLSKEDVLILKSQSKLGKPKDIDKGNRERAREQYADHFNSEGDGDGGWSADAAYSAGD